MILFMALFINILILVVFPVWKSQSKKSNEKVKNEAHIKESSKVDY